jgi:hypothetical protein
LIDSRNHRFVAADLDQVVWPVDAFQFGDIDESDFCTSPGKFFP